MLLQFLYRELFLREFLMFDLQLVSHIRLVVSDTTYAEDTKDRTVASHCAIRAHGLNKQCTQECL